MSGLHRLSREERLKRVQAFCDLSEQEIAALSGEKSLTDEMAEHLIENVVGCFSIPLGIATHFRVDGRDLVIPMAVEETSIIAAASATAKWIKRSGSIETFSKGDLIIGQLQFPLVKDVERAAKILREKKDSIVQIANEELPGLRRRGAGVKDILVREIPRTEGEGTMLVLHLLCDPGDAMGANLINQACEAVKPHVESWTGERVGMCILSNLIDGKLVGARVTLPKIDPELGIGIEEASLFAEADPYRATTHNKGTMNGIDPILIVTGNDWRAAEACVHAYASRSGKYRPITRWRMEEGDLVGTIEIPIPLGTVGGVTRLHPTAKVALKMLGVSRAEELARICAAVGLVQNLGALKALSTEGIVRGHMQLHAANLAIAAGAEKDEIPKVQQKLAQLLREDRKINLTNAKEVLESIRVPSQSSLQL